MKLKKKVIKFKKVVRYRMAHQFDDAYSTICGSYVISWTMDKLRDYEGFVCSFRDKDPTDTLKCKLVICVPEENYAEFIKDFLAAFNGYIEKVSW